MFDRLSTRIFGVIAALGLLVASFLFGFGVGRTAPAPEAVRYDLLKEAEDQVRSSGVREVEHKTLVQGAVRGMLEALGDPYAEYLDPETYRSFRDVSAGHFSGVGLWLKPEAKRIKVVSVLANTPAARAGIASGDIITRVDRRSTEKLSLEQVAQRIKGKPGTTVRISVLRGEQPVEFTLVREDIEVPTVESKLLRDRLGHVEVITFSQGVGSKVREAVKKLAGRGARGFILDLRGNPGGLVDEAVEVGSVFLEGGTVVSYEQRGRPEVTYEARGSAETKLPLAVLVDEGSASASEIVAGAIQDRGRGIIVGTKTYGKGSIQTVFPLSDGSAIKITTASYFTPSGRSIGERGITPDVIVVQKETQLARAQQILHEILADAPEHTAA